MITADTIVVQRPAELPRGPLRVVPATRATTVFLHESVADRITGAASTADIRVELAATSAVRSERAPETAIHVRVKFLEDAIWNIVPPDDRPVMNLQFFVAPRRSDGPPIFSENGCEQTEATREICLHHA
jgi:hypothetical protein